MTDEIQGTAVEQPAEDDLSATLAAAVKESAETDEDDTSDVDKTEDTAETEPDKETDTEHSKEATSSDDETAESKDDADKTEDSGDEQVEEPAIEPPAMFSAEDKELFSRQSRESQEFLLRRTQEMDADHTRKTQELAETRKAADAFNVVLAPYQAYIASRGGTPEQAVQKLMAAEYQLTTGTTEQKATLLVQLAADYGVPLDNLLNHSEDEPPSPEITRIQQNQAVMHQRQAAMEQQAEIQNQQAIATQVTVFSEEQDSSGNPLRPHFAEVRQAMGAAINVQPDMDMQTAYENAVWTNPKLREANLASERQKAEQAAKQKQEKVDKKAEQERKEKAKKAMKAASGVKARAEPTGPGTDIAELTLRDSLAKEYERASSSP